MLDRARQKILAAAALKIAVLCIILPLLSIANTRAQTATEAEIAPLIEKLKSNDEAESSNAASALANIGESAVPALVEALKDQDEKIRLSAVQVLYDMGTEAKAAVPAIADALKDKNLLVRRKAVNFFKKIDEETSSAAPNLAEVLKEDSDNYMRTSAANALGKMGANAKAAVPLLIEALKNNNQQIRLLAIDVLGKIGADAKAAVPDLIKALNDKDEGDRAEAAQALGRIGAETALTVPALIEALKDEGYGVSSNAALALGKMGNKAQSALPLLVEMLKSDKISLRQSAAAALINSAASFQENASAISIGDLNNAISHFEKALKTIASPKSDFPKERIESLGVYVDALKANRKSRANLIEKAVDLMGKNPAIALATAYIVLMPSLWLIILGIRPLWLLHLNDLMQVSDLTLPLPSGPLTVSVRTLLVIQFFNYHPRVLDAWVAKYIELARKEFQQKETVRSRPDYRPAPALLNNRPITHLTAEDLRSTFAKKRACLLIWGELETGKTSLACQIAKWGMASDRTKRLRDRPMIPVLIEHELDMKIAAGKQPFTEAIRAQLQITIGQSNISGVLLEHLLKRQRILAIVDRLSEMNDVSRAEIRPGHPDFPAHALIVTSRIEEKLDGVPKSTIKL